MPSNSNQLSGDTGYLLQTLLKLHLNSCCQAHTLGVSQQKSKWMTLTHISHYQNTPHPRNTAQMLYHRRCCWVPLLLAEDKHNQKQPTSEPISSSTTGFQVLKHNPWTALRTAQVHWCSRAGCRVSCHVLAPSQTHPQSGEWKTWRWIDNPKSSYPFSYSTPLKRKGVVCRACLPSPSSQAARGADHLLQRAWVEE